MGLEADGSKLLLGRGKVYFDRFAAGTVNKTGARFLGECGKFEINPTIQTKEKYSLAKASSTLLATNIVSQLQELNIEMDEFVPENLALALLGDTSTITQTGGAIVAEPIPFVAANARVYKTVNRQISAVTVKKGATAGVAGTDFNVIDAAMGLVEILVGGAFAAGDTLTVDYTAAAILVAAALNEVRGGKTSTVDGYLLFVGDPANGLAYDVEAWHVRVNPSGALAMIGEDYGTIPLKFQILDDSVNHPNEPLYKMIQRA